MRRSKLEMHIAVLKALAHHGKPTITHIAHAVNINSRVLKGCLDVLIKLDLVEKHVLRKNSRKAEVMYALTEKGVTVLQAAREVDHAIPLVEGAATVNRVLE